MMRRPSALVVAAVLMGCAEPGPDAGFGERAARGTGTFVGSTAVLLVLQVLIPAALVFSAVTRTPIFGTEPIEPPARPVAAQESVEASHSAR